MYGPCPPGHFTARGGTDDFQMLRAGRAYRVTRPFADYDGDLHPAGESWIYLGDNFVPYHDGLSLFVSLDGAQEWQIRLSWRGEDQAHIIDGLPTYLAPG
jgi:hypothetical protein